MSVDTVRRYVLTHSSKVGLGRVLMYPCQSRYTYLTRDEAEAELRNVLANNSEHSLKELFGFPLEVREVDCWPHGDPKSRYAD